MTQCLCSEIAEMLKIWSAIRRKIEEQERSQKSVPDSRQFPQPNLQPIQAQIQELRVAKNTQPTKLLLSIRELAKVLGVCERTIFTLTQENQLPHLRIGRCVKYPVSEIEKWIEAQTQGSK